MIGDHFGDNHPVYACGLNDVALMCKSMGDLERASTLYQKAIKIYDYVFFLMMKGNEIDLWKESCFYLEDDDEFGYFIQNSW